MTTPAQYQYQLDELTGRSVTVDGLTPAQAKTSLEAVEDLISHAQEIERAINLDMHVIRTQFRSRSAAASAGLSSRVMVSHKNRPGSKDRAGEVELIDAERDAKLAPYEEVKKKIEEYLASLDVTRSTLEKQAKKPGKAQPNE